MHVYTKRFRNSVLSKCIMCSFPSVAHNNNSSEKLLSHLIYLGLKKMFLYKKNPFFIVRILYQAVYTHRILLWQLLLTKVFSCSQGYLLFAIMYIISWSKSCLNFCLNSFPPDLFASIQVHHICMCVIIYLYYVHCSNTKINCKMEVKLFLCLT